MYSRERFSRYFYIGAIVFAVLLGTGLGGLAWMKFLSTQKPPTPVQEVSVPQPTVLATPTRDVSIQLDNSARLLIPAIGVDAPIELVGQDSKGRMEVPVKHQWNGVGWYKQGAVPGRLGSAVLDGHLDTNTGAPAVFWKLRNIHVGDVVAVKDKNGHTAQFRVFKLQDYSINSAPLDQIFNKKDGAYLNLITCSGTWDYTQNQFLQRLVVFTKLLP